MKNLNLFIRNILMLLVLSLFFGEAFAQFPLNIGSIPPGDSVVVTFQVTITEPFPDDITQVSNQGVVSGSNFDPVYTDDPNTVALNDSTVTPVFLGLPHRFVLFAEEDVLIYNQDNSSGDIHANNDIKFLSESKNKKSINVNEEEYLSNEISERNLLNEGDAKTFHEKSMWIHTGNLSAVDDIKISKNYTIDGNAVAGDNIQNHGTITGTYQSKVDVAWEELPELAFSAGGTTVIVNDYESATLTPDSYNKVSVKKAGTLNLSSGEYFFNKLIMGYRSILSIDVSNGPVTINVVSNLFFGKRSQVVMAQDGETRTHKIVFNSLQKDELIIHSYSKVLGTIIAPNSKNVKMFLSADLVGSICAQNIFVYKDATFKPHSIITSAPAPAVPNLKKSSESEIDLLTKQQHGIPTVFRLEQNYPNPFNPTTTISFGLPKESQVRIDILNLNGQRVRSLKANNMNAGYHSILWDGRNDSGSIVSSGIYIYLLKAGNFLETKKMIFLK